MSNRQPSQDWTRGPEDEGSSLVDQITRLSEAMAGSSVTELEMVEDGLTIRLQRRPIQVLAAAQPMQPVALAMPATGPGAAPAPPTAPAEMTLAVLAPLTGVFYSAASPSDPPFVQPGDMVQPGQVVCMVEAMKVFNEIKTEIGGTVVAIPPKNGQLVKKGDPLVRIKPA
jgi:acetyl-CoA carboxylase biotin carboxyl carrier protein